ncbi:hypothetical protein [Ottowia sp.]|uniref:hypothetical protein n=1 Tax=Ottowia sp. TaxID=1898956 RepID=UPI002C934DFE|nr:hypothetical protein [Ottowia sp.]HOB66635.1 hypothetical protein [Ottowia sp.]HPZ56471.1 hypothetical protein [Ottowia sp.]HQD47631.1 hypothetical protein [Ottowia sp.]
MSTNIHHANTSSVPALQPQLFDDPPPMTIAALTNRIALLRIRCELDEHKPLALARLANRLDFMLQTAEDMKWPGLLVDAAEMLAEATARWREDRCNSERARDGGSHA